MMLFDMMPDCIIIQSMPGNPFFFESPTDRWSFTDRDTIVGTLKDFMTARGRRLLVHGRRRIGKTSVIQIGAQKGRAALVYVDISKAASLADIAKKLLDSAPRNNDDVFVKVVKLAQRHFTNLSLGKGIFTLGGDFRSEDPRETLEKVLNFLNDRVDLTGEPITVCFDEFQDLQLVAGDRADWFLRSVIQPHRHLNYLFSGSDRRLIKWMTGPESAFFKQLQELEVGPIDPVHFATWIDDRARAAGHKGPPFGTEAVITAGPCTGDIVRLAKAAFDLAAKGHTKSLAATALDAIALVELNGEFVARWSDLTVIQRSVLVAVAAGAKATAQATVRLYDLGSSASAQTAVRKLVDRQILVRNGRTVHFDSPFYKYWVAANAA